MTALNLINRLAVLLAKALVRCCQFFLGISSAKLLELWKLYQPSQSIQSVCANQPSLCAKHLTREIQYFFAGCINRKSPHFPLSCFYIWSFQVWRQILFFWKYCYACVVHMLLVFLHCHTLSDIWGTIKNPLSSLLNLIHFFPFGFQVGEGLEGYFKTSPQATASVLYIDIVVNSCDYSESNCLPALQICDTFHPLSLSPDCSLCLLCLLLTCLHSCFSICPLYSVMFLNCLKHWEYAPYTFMLLLEHDGRLYKSHIIYY